jgi:hypothetical protein
MVELTLATYIITLNAVGLRTGIKGIDCQSGSLKTKKKKEEEKQVK